jgi:hypothetical protein
MERRIRYGRRRKWKRFVPKGGTIVLLHPDDLKRYLVGGTVELGPVINISLGGLMVQYIDSKDRQRKANELSILGKSDGMRVEKIPFDTLVDFEVASLPDGKTVRNRGLRFGQLSLEQAFQLEAFIKAHGTEAVHDRRDRQERREVDDRRFDDPEFNLLYNRRTGLDRRK